MLMMAWKLGPALATGCTVVIKTAPQTPLSALRVAALAKEVGFPDGAINIIPGDDETGKLLTAHDGLDKVAFTGSTPVGREIMIAAAKSPKLNRVSLELGGKSPLIAFDDSDIDTLVATAHVGLFLNQGQCCCAGSRIFVQDTIYDEFVEKSAEAAKARVVGPGWEAGSQQGSQVSQEQLDTIMHYIDAGKKEGATLVAGGNKGKCAPRLVGPAPAPACARFFGWGDSNRARVRGAAVARVSSPPRTHTPTHPPHTHVSPLVLVRAPLRLPLCRAVQWTRRATSWSRPCLPTWATT